MNLPFYYIFGVFIHSISAKFPIIVLPPEAFEKEGNFLNVNKILFTGSFYR